MNRILRDVSAFVWEQRKFWLLPILAALLLVGALVVLSETSPLAPFIYPFF